MLVQIDGAGFHNRGAQLMLWHTIQRLKAALPNVKFASEPSFSNYLQRASYGLHTCFPGAVAQRPRRSPLIIRYGDIISSVLPKKLSNQYGIARRCDIDALVDISGYTFGDKWGPSKSRLISQRVLQMHRKKKPSILMPQMFGPFKNSEVRDAFRPALEKATLIYARDEVSFECLQEINKTKREILLSPDLTISTHPTLPDDLPNTPYACIVPNQRMLDKSGGKWNERYINTLTSAINELKSNEITPYVLIHDGTQEDLAVGQALINNAGLTEDSLLIHDDPLMIKGYIANAVMLIGSRFHAIVGALSTATPAIAIGWAHKYEMLLKDFCIPQYAFSDEQTDEELCNMVRQLADKEENQKVVEILKSSKEPMLKETELMWDRVTDVLKSCRAS